MSDREQAPGTLPPEPNASDEAHDVLAAEEFAMPAPEAAWRDRPVQPPPEPNASDEPHDVLAAEAFAMPAPPPHVAFASAPEASKRPTRRHLAAAVAGLGAALLGFVRRRSRAGRPPATTPHRRRRRRG